MEIRRRRGCFYQDGPERKTRFVTLPLATASHNNMNNIDVEGTSKPRGGKKAPSKNRDVHRDDDGGADAINGNDTTRGVLSGG